MKLQIDKQTNVYMASLFSWSAKKTFLWSPTTYSLLQSPLWVDSQIQIKSLCANTYFFDEVLRVDISWMKMLALTLTMQGKPKQTTAKLFLPSHIKLDTKLTVHVNDSYKFVVDSFSIGLLQWQDIMVKSQRVQYVSRYDVRLLVLSGCCLTVISRISSVSWKYIPHRRHEACWTVNSKEALPYVVLNWKPIEIIVECGLSVFWRH